MVGPAGAEKASEYGKRVHLRNLAGWLSLLPLVLLILFCSGQVSVWGFKTRSAADVQSQLTVNYAQWPYEVVAPMNPAVLQAILDEEGQRSSGDLIVPGVFLPTPTPTRTRPGSARTPTPAAPRRTSSPTYAGLNATGTLTPSPDSPTALPTRTRLPTVAALSPTPSLTPGITASATPVGTATISPTPTRTITLTPTRTRTYFPVKTNTPTRTRTHRPSRTPTRTMTFTQTPTRTVTQFVNLTVTWTLSPSPTRTITRTPSATTSLTATPTRTTIPPAVSYTFTPTLTPGTSTVTYTPTPIFQTPTPTDTPVTPTVTDTPVPTITDTPIPTITDTPIPTITDTPVPTITDTPIPTITDTPVPTITDTPETPTPTPLPTQIPLPPGMNIGPPDGNYYEVGCGGGIVVDLGVPTWIGTLVYYEVANPSDPGNIALDWVIVSVSDSADGPWTLIFYWGDSNSGNNGSVPPIYYPPENDNQAIPFGQLYNNTGILIGVGGTYRYVLIEAPPGCGDEAQVDAIEVLP